MKSFLTPHFYARMLMSVFLLLTFSASATQRPDTLLEAQTNKILQELQKDHGAILQDMGQLNRMVERLIAPIIDFDAMSKLVLGKYWKKASAAQRTSFQASFRSLLKGTYTRSLQKYASQTINYFPARTRIKGKYATVYSEFSPGGGAKNLSITYKLRLKNGTWKAYNLEIEGLSFVTSYRRDFTREIQDLGLDTFLANLRRKTTSGRSGKCPVTVAC